MQSTVPASLLRQLAPTTEGRPPREEGNYRIAGGLGGVLLALTTLSRQEL